MATGPTQQAIFGQGRIPYPFKCYRIKNPFSKFPVLPNKPGIYIFADLSNSKSNNINNIDPNVLYVGKTKSYNERVTEDHEKLNDAITLNTTHICLLDETSENKRVAIESDIYDKHKPSLNDRKP